MPSDPKDWRAQADLTLASAAMLAGIQGRNPSKTYSRYETGESPCPAAVVEKIRAGSNGQVTAESWHAVRLAFLKSKEPSELSGPASPPA